MARELSPLQTRLLEALRGVPDFWWSVSLLAIHLDEPRQEIAAACEQLARLRLLQRSQGPAAFFRLAGRPAEKGRA